MLFASHNAFRGYSLSRRDDLIQLAYLLCFLVTGQFTWMGGKDLLEDDNYFDEIYKLKLKIKPSNLCVHEATPFEGFVREAFRLGFKETPCYDKIRHLIRSACLDKEIAPNAIFEWSQFKVRNPWLIEKDLLRESG